MNDEKLTTDDIASLISGIDRPSSRIIDLAKEIYTIGYEAGVKATNVDCGVVWEERIDAIKAEITDMAKEFEKQCDYGRYYGLNYALEIIDKHCGGDAE